MAFNTSAPAYWKWQTASNARKKAWALWSANRNNPTLATKYKNAYNQAKNLQNTYAAQVRNYKAPSQNTSSKGNTPPVPWMINPNAINAPIQKRAVTPAKTRTQDSIDHWASIVAWQSATWTSTPKITASKLTTSTPSTPSYWNTSYQSNFWWNKVTTSNNPNDTSTKPTNTTFNPANAWATYNEYNKKIGFLWGKNLTSKTFEKFWWVSWYVNKYSDNIDKLIKAWKITQNEANSLKSNLSKTLKDKVWYVDNNTLTTPDAWVWISTSYWYWTDSKWNTIRTTTTSRINYDEIANKIWWTLFKKQWFRNNFDKYINSLKSQIEDQRKSLDASNAQLTDMFKNQEADFQWQYWNILNDINKREAETKSRLWTIEDWINQKFQDVSKTLWEQKAWEKAWLSANLRARWLSEWAISNALTAIDTKYAQSSRKDYAAYQDNLKSLAWSYDNLAKDIISNKSTLTQSKLNFSNALLNRSKQLIDTSRSFDKAAIDTLYKPVNDILWTEVKNDAVEKEKLDQKQRKLDSYSQWDASMKIKILSDNLIWMNWLNTKAITNDILSEAAKFWDLTKALTYIKEKLYSWDAKSAAAIDTSISEFTWGSTSSDSTKTSEWWDSNIKVEWTEKKWKSWVASKDMWKSNLDELWLWDVDKQNISDTISWVTSWVPELNTWGISKAESDKMLEMYKNKMSDFDYKTVVDIWTTIWNLQSKSDMSPEKRALINRQVWALHAKYPDLLIPNFLKDVTRNNINRINESNKKNLAEMATSTWLNEDQVNTLIWKLHKLNNNDEYTKVINAWIDKFWSYDKYIEWLDNR